MRSYIVSIPFDDGNAVMHFITKAKNKLRAKEKASKVAKTSDHAFVLPCTKDARVKLKQ